MQGKKVGLSTEQVAMNRCRKRNGLSFTLSTTVRFSSNAAKRAKREEYQENDGHLSFLPFSLPHNVHKVEEKIPNAAKKNVNVKIKH